MSISSTDLQRHHDTSTLHGSANWLLAPAVLLGIDTFFWGLGLPLRLLVFGVSVSQWLEMQLPGPAWLALNGVLALVFIGLAWFARRGHQWAFLAGLGLCMADGAVSLYRGDWVNAGSHLLLLWGLWVGLKAARALRHAPAA